MFEYSVEEVNSGSFEDISPMALYPVPGTYSYQYTYRQVHLLYPDTSLGLKTFFQTNSSGVKIYDTSTTGTSSFFPVSVNPKSSKIGIATAYSEGSTANSFGDYTVNVLGTNGIAILSWECRLETRLMLRTRNVNSTHHDIRISNYYHD